MTDISSATATTETPYENIILIPYRNRKEHLEYFLEHSWKLIQEHLPKTKLVIIEQDEGKLFNRGMVLNIGFQENKDKGNYFITHDVDVNPNEKAVELYKLIPDDKCIIGIYSSPCVTLGGILKIKNDTFSQMNGFPNNFWGWGVEDRALYNRAVCHNFKISFNIISRTEKAAEYFRIFNDVNDRKTDSAYSSRDSFEYRVFQKLPKEKQLGHIMSSGLNTLEYTILEKKELQANVEWIKVHI